MIKIAFILDHDLMNYRISFFNQLATIVNYEITVFHPGKKKEMEGLFFSQFTTKKIKLFSVFQYNKMNKPNSFDIIICMQNIRLINLWLLSLNFFRKYKLIQWGIGVSSANGLDNQSFIVTFLRNVIMKFSDAIIFYSPYPIKFVHKAYRNKCFVALNTVYNKFSEDFSACKKDSFLFIGTMNKRKGLDEMVIAFHCYLKKEPKSINKMLIIGEGVEYENIQKYIVLNNLENNIKLLGKIESDEEKMVYFKRSIASFSLNQAGLSVLESFSFGVPYITKKNAISGGEHLNILDKKNGFLVENIEDFIKKLFWFDQNPMKAQKLGNNAFKYYKNKANMDLMTREFEKTINYVQKEQ